MRYQTHMDGACFCNRGIKWKTEQGRLRVLEEINRNGDRVATGAAAQLEPTASSKIEMTCTKASVTNVSINVNGSTRGACFCRMKTQKLVLDMVVKMASSLTEFADHCVEWEWRMSAQNAI